MFLRVRSRTLTSSPGQQERVPVQFDLLGSAAERLRLLRLHRLPGQIRNVPTRWSAAATRRRNFQRDDPRGRSEARMQDAQPHPTSCRRVSGVTASSLLGICENNWSG